jgi:hypothetical protein
MMPAVLCLIVLAMPLVVATFAAWSDPRPWLLSFSSFLHVLGQSLPKRDVRSGSAVPPYSDQISDRERGRLISKPEASRYPRRKIDCHTVRRTSYKKTDVLSISQ